VKVKCKTDGYTFFPLLGEVYEVMSIEDEWYRIYSSFYEEDYLLPRHFFEIVEGEPKPPILTFDKAAIY